MKVSTFYLALLFALPLSLGFGVRVLPGLGGVLCHQPVACILDPGPEVLGGRSVLLVEQSDKWVARAGEEDNGSGRARAGGLDRCAPTRYEHFVTTSR